MGGQIGCGVREEWSKITDVLTLKVVIFRKVENIWEGGLELARGTDEFAGTAAKPKHLLTVCVNLDVRTVILTA